MQAHDAPRPTTSQPGLRIFIRPLGNPLPLGFLGLGGATFVLAGLELGWISVLQSQHVALVMIAFAAPLQLLAAVLAFLARDSATGSAMGVLAGTWAVTGLSMLASVPGATSGALGLLLFVTGTALLTSVASAGTSKLTASAVLLVASVRFVLTGVYELTADPAWRTAAGVTGVVLAGLAVLAALAFGSEDGGRPLLPTLRRAPDGSSALPTALGSVRGEAGVREHL